ncbi:hypothetical protein [Alkalibacillus silvisoli]|uniref:LPS export ABC transporter periplasmic protein LptC n=1 Tax=Alkalibacillus silvisoli TaxID=392823 RepID=A0ABP3JHM9_9BACI
MAKRILLISLTAFLVIGGSLLAVNGLVDRKSMQVDETGWAFSAQLNQDLLYSYADEEAMYEQAIEEKLGFNLSDQDVTGEVDVVLTEVRRVEDHVLEGEGQAYFTTDEFEFDLEFDEAQVYQIEGEETGVIRGMSIDGEFTTVSGELDMLSFNMYWNPVTEEVYAVGSVGFVTNYGMLAFGEPFVEQDEFSSESLIDFE